MAINSVSNAGNSAYLPQSSAFRANPDQAAAAAILDEQRRVAAANRTRLGLDQLEANSAASRARVGIAAVQTSDAESEGPAFPHALTLEEKLALIAEEGKYVDRSNMSDKEILEEIYGRFGKYFDRDIFPPFHDNPLSDQNSVNEALFKELKGLNLMYERLEEARAEMWGYDGMTNAEMKKAIAEKYASQEMTTANFLRMMTEMDQTGAMDWRVVNDICRTVSNSVQMEVMKGFVQKGYTFWEILSDYQNIAGEAIWEAYNSKTSISDLYGGAEYMMTKGGRVNLQTENNVHSIFKELMELGLR